MQNRGCEGLEHDIAASAAAVAAWAKWACAGTYRR